MKEQLKKTQYTFGGTQSYETLIAAIPGGLIITKADEKFTVLFANQGYFKMVGYEVAEHEQTFYDKGINTLHPGEAKAAVDSARRQLAENGTFSVRARLRHKTKGYIWVHFNGRLSEKEADEVKIYIVMMDISEQVDALEKLEQENSFHELVATLSEEYFFDCNLATGSVRYSKNFQSKLEFLDNVQKYEEAFLKLGLLGGASGCETMEELIFSLSREPERELYLERQDGEGTWYLCRCNLLYGREGEPVRIVGKLIDITRHKMQIDELSHLAHKDQLTGLYNKKATESRIKETLKMRRLHDDRCALFVIDIDNFKNVNDKLGHLYGDAVLTQLAERLKGLFRADDIVGRVGGDEFFVFVKSYRSTQILETKAKEICAVFHKTYSEKDAFVTISASIGIALCPEHDTDFDGLYKKGDAALYEAKANGKNGFAFYTPSLTQNYSSERTEIDVNTMKKSFKDSRTEYVFRLLYDSENQTASIQAVLQLVTESFGFSRGYIFESSADGKFTSNTFEWCIQEITPEIHNLQNLPMEAVATANRSFLESGMFILKNIKELPEIERNVLEPQGILSMFQFGIMDMGKLVGFIGFDDCMSEHIPSDAEIDEICTVCHVLSTFLLKHRSNERKMLQHEALELVVDHLNSFTYVIDTETHVVLYENQKMIDSTGKSVLGQRCYEVYHGRKQPCEQCPFAHLTPDRQRHVMEVYDETRNLYLHTEAAYIEWSGERQAALLWGVDITRYKKG